MSPAPRTTQADLVARLPFAGLRLPASPVEEWDARWGKCLALPRSCTLVVGRGVGAAQPPRCLVAKLPPTDPGHSCWGGYPFSSRVSVASGQQLDWRGVRHTRELCGDADPSGHLRESYTPSISIKSTSDLGRHHMPWDYLERNNSMSPLGTANNHAWLWQTSTLMTTGGLLRAAFDAASSSNGAGLATPENVSPPTHSVVTVSALLQCLYEVRI